MKNEPRTGYHLSLIYILQFTYFRLTYVLPYRRPIIIQFNLFVYFRTITPFYRITFTLRITFTIIIFRGLEEEEKNVTAICELKPDGYDNETKIGLYECNATVDSENEPSRVESFNDFVFSRENGKDRSEFPIEEEHQYGVNFSPEANKASYNFINQKENIQSFVSFDGNVTRNDTDTFYMLGQLTGKNAEKIAKQNQLTFTFYDANNLNKTPVNETCNVINHDVDDFQVKCDPVHNMSQYYIFQSNGSVDDIGITLNMSEHQDYVDITKYSSSYNSKWRKNSSGLSGGSIAAIVIACAVVLILITILVLCFSRRKIIDTNNSTMVGLRTIDNENSN